MGKPRKTNKVNMGGLFEPALATKFAGLCQINGISIREALRRLMVNSILENRIPGIDALELEQREHEKWGSATPVYDGTRTNAPKGAAKQAPASHSPSAES